MLLTGSDATHHHNKGLSTKFIYEMCDTNDGGDYHDDPECQALPRTVTQSRPGPGCERATADFLGTWSTRPERSTHQNEPGGSVGT